MKAGDPVNVKISIRQYKSGVGHRNMIRKIPGVIAEIDERGVWVEYQNADFKHPLSKDGRAIELFSLNSVETRKWLPEELEVMGKKKV